LPLAIPPGLYSRVEKVLRDSLAVTFHSTQSNFIRSSVQTHDGITNTLCMIGNKEYIH